MNRIRLTIALLALLLTACAAQSAAPPASTATSDAMMGMDHGAMMGDQPFDAMFLDGMIVHHEGAITMAQQALEESERSEIRTLAEGIIAAQEDENAKMAEWRAAWYPDLAPTMMEDMETMGMMGEMMELSSDSSIPFDQRFLDAMIPHHQGAVAMARQAVEQAEHPELKALAEGMIAAQEGEIAQMEAWRAEWFGE